MREIEDAEYHFRLQLNDRVIGLQLSDLHEQYYAFKELCSPSRTLLMQFLAKAGELGKMENESKTKKLEKLENFIDSFSSFFKDFYECL